MGARLPAKPTISIPTADDVHDYTAASMMIASGVPCNGDDDDDPSSVLTSLSVPNLPSQKLNQRS